MARRKKPEKKGADQAEKAVDVPAQQPSRPPGRPSLLRPELQTRVCELVAQGVPFDNACRLSGIAKETGYEWLRRGLGYDKGRPATPEFATFAHAIALARARDEQRRIALITAAGSVSEVTRKTTTTTKDGTVTVVEEVRQVPGDWRAHAWVLERRDPERWAPVTAVTSGPAPNGGGPLSLDMRDVLERIDAKRATGGAPLALPAAPPEPKDPRPPRKP